MKHTQLLSLFALLTLSVAANAQPDPNNAPKGDNPVNRAVGGNRNRVAVQNMTPEQRQELMRTTLKRQLTRVNVTNLAQQNAVADYVIAEAQARPAIEEATRALQTGLRNTNLTDAQVAGLLNEYNATLADDKARHEKELAKLNAAIDVTQFPRLEAMLTVAGVYGETPVLTGNLVSLLGAGARYERTTRRDNADAANRQQLNAIQGGARGNVANRRNNNNNRPAPF